MDKDLRQYLPYYLGRDYWTNNSEGNLNATTLPHVIDMIKRNKGVQLHLRKLESMTEEELRWYFDSIKRPEDELDCFEWVTEQNGQPVDHPHWTMWCKDQTWARHGYVLGGSEERYEPKQFHYLLSRGFDLFNLIENGLAIDKGTLPE